MQYKLPTIKGDVTRFINTCGDRQIFRRCLLFATSADHRRIFSTLNHVVNGQAADVCRPPLGDCSATARFAPQMTKFSADVPTTIGRRPSGDSPGHLPMSPSDDNKSYDHRQVIGRSPFGHRAVYLRVLLWVKF